MIYLFTRSVRRPLVRVNLVRVALAATTAGILIGGSAADPAYAAPPLSLDAAAAAASAATTTTTAPARPDVRKVRRRRRAPAAAAGAPSTAAAEVGGASTAVRRSKEPGAGAVHPLFVRVGLALGQESIGVTAPAGTATMTTQMQSLAIGAAYGIPLGRARWTQLHALEFNYGFAKGKANGKKISDQVKGQSFYSLGVAPGVAYVTSPASRVGLSLPFVMRQIKWNVGDEGFNPDRDNSFSIGIAGLYETRFSVRSSLVVTATYQHLWRSTSFNIAYQRRLR